MFLGPQNKCVNWRIDRHGPNSKFSKLVCGYEPAGIMEDQGWELVPSYQLKHIDSGPAPKVEHLNWTGHDRMIRICQVRISIAS